MPDQQNIKKSEALEISIGDLILFIRRYFLLVTASAIGFAILGYAYSFTLPKLFTAQTVLLPEYSMSNSNSFFSMAVGSDRTGAEKLVPELYPNILNSTPFGQYLLKQPVVDEFNKKYKSLEEYLSKDTEPSLVSSIISGIMSVFKGKTPPQKKVSKSLPSPGIVVLSNEEQARISSAIGLINIIIDDKNGLISLECEMEDPVIAAILIEATRKYLIAYVEDYRTSKTTEQLVFLDKMAGEAKERQQRAEYSLQSYRDRNRGSFLNVARIEEQRLQAEYTLAQSIYSDLIIKLEQAKIKVKEEKPVFKILEHAKVPVNRSSPKRTIIAFVFAVAGAFGMLVYIVFFKEKYHLRLLQ